MTPQQQGSQVSGNLETGGGDMTGRDQYNVNVNVDRDTIPGEILHQVLRIRSEVGNTMDDMRQEIGDLKADVAVIKERQLGNGNPGIYKRMENYENFLQRIAKRVDYILIAIVIVYLLMGVIFVVK